MNGTKMSEMKAKSTVEKMCASASCRAGGPVHTKPTRVREAPAANKSMICLWPGKPPSCRRRFWIVHIKPASTGLESSVMSFPYKHRPASRRSASLAPSPAIADPSPQSRSASSAPKSDATLTSKPSSPVYLGFQIAQI